MWPNAANPERLADGGDSSKTADWAQEELLVPNFWCPAPNRLPKRGPRCASNCSGNRPGSVPGECWLFDGIRMPFVPGTFWGCLVRSFASLAPWRETLFRRSLAALGILGSHAKTQRRKDAKTDGEMRDCPRGFSREGRIDDCRVMIVDFRSGRSPQIGARHIKQGPRCASIWGCNSPGVCPR